MLGQSAREAARIVATTNSNKKAVSLISSNLNNKNLIIESINIVPENESKRAVGDYIKIKIKVRYNGITKALTNLVLAGFNKDEKLIEAESSMRMECSSNP